MEGTRWPCRKVQRPCGINMELYLDSVVSRVDICADLADDDDDDTDERATMERLSIGTQTNRIKCLI